MPKQQELFNDRIAVENGPDHWLHFYRNKPFMIKVVANSNHTETELSGKNQIQNTYYLDADDARNLIALLTDFVNDKENETIMEQLKKDFPDDDINEQFL